MSKVLGLIEFHLSITKVNQEEQYQKLQSLKTKVKVKKGLDYIVEVLRVREFAHYYVIQFTKVDINSRILITLKRIFESSQTKDSSCSLL